MRSRRLRGFDLRALADRSGLLGIDEAGRGALAGPVVAAAVAVRRTFYDSSWCRRNAGRVNDSKQLSPEERDWLYERVLWLESEGRLHVGVGLGEVEEIEERNILGATQLAMNRAAENALKKAGVALREPDPLFAGAETAGDGAEALEPLSRWEALVDGRPLKSLAFPHRGVVGGDGRSLCVALASVVAKVARDRLMDDLGAAYAAYGLSRCKGYATPAHRAAIARLGPSPVHRRLFLRKLLARRESPGQAQFGFACGGESAPEEPQA